MSNDNQAPGAFEPQAPLPEPPEGTEPAEQGDEVEAALAQPRLTAVFQGR